MRIKDVIKVISLLSVILLLTVNPAFSQEQYAEAQTAYMQPGVMADLPWSDEPPVLSEKQKAFLKSMLDKIHLPGPSLPVSGAPVAGPAYGTEMPRPDESYGAEPSASSPPVLFKTVDLTGWPSGYKSTVLEPAAANIGKYIFYTGNWYAARSNNQGVTWTYVSPFSGFTDFCCDQDVIYDKTRDAMFWLRMGSPDGSGENVFKLGVSTNGGTSFCTYSVSPASVNGTWTNEWWDYPQLALTNNSLYITWNIFNQSDVWQRQVLLRYPLQELAACSGFSYGYIARTDGYTWAPAQGGTTKLYWGDHISTTTFRVYTWQENTGTYSWANRTIPAWTSTGRGSANCPAPDGNDACKRFDHRVLNGYVKRHPALAFGQLEIVGFFWNVKEGSGFTYPYTNNAWFYTNTMNYGGRHSISASWAAWIYTSSYPDVRGNLGVAGTYAGGSYYPRFWVGKDDDTDGIPPYWGYVTVASGNAGPGNNKWGDYNRVRQFLPLGTCWLATGHVLQGGTTGIYVHPYYVVFGQGRDFNSCYQRWKQLG